MPICGKNKIKAAEAKAAAEEAERLAREAKEEADRIKREEEEQLRKEKQKLADDQARLAAEKDRVEALQREVEEEKERQAAELARIKEAEDAVAEKAVLQKQEIEEERERLNEEREVKMREAEEVLAQKEAEQQVRVVEATAFCQAEEAKVRLLKGEQDRIIKERDDLAVMRKDMMTEQQYIKDERTKIELQIKDILSLRDGSWTTETFEIVKEIHHDGRTQRESRTGTGTGTGTVGYSSQQTDSDKGMVAAQCGYAPGSKLLCCGQSISTNPGIFAALTDGGAERMLRGTMTEDEQGRKTAKQLDAAGGGGDFGAQVKVAAERFKYDSSAAAHRPFGGRCSFYEVGQHDQSKCIVCRNFQFDDQPLFL